jgi:hypothetical protein
MNIHLLNNSLMNDQLYAASLGTCRLFPIADKYGRSSVVRFGPTVDRTEV